MPYHMLESMLGATFVGIWVFIGVTMLRDKLTEARQKRVSLTAPAPKFAKRRRRQSKRDRAVAGA